MSDPSDGAYPSRRWVVPLSTTIMVGFGIILYGFSVYAKLQSLIFFELLPITIKPTTSIKPSTPTLAVLTVKPAQVRQAA